MRAQGRLSEHAARLTSTPDLTGPAREHAALLAGIVPRQLQSIEPLSDQRPLQQMHATLSYVAAMPATHPDAGRVAAALARSQPDIIDVLHRTARHQLATGAWLVSNPNERSTTAIWVRQTAPAEGQPDLVHRLTEARTTAHHLAQAAGVNPFPDTAAAIALATARQGLPPRYAITTPAFPATTTRPPAPGRSPGRTPDIER